LAHPAPGAVFEIREEAQPALDWRSLIGDVALGMRRSSILRAACLPPLMALDMFDAPVMTSRGIKSGPAGLERESIYRQRAFVLEFETGSAAEVLVERLATPESRCRTRSAAPHLWDRTLRPDLSYSPRRVLTISMAFTLPSGRR